MAAVSPTVRTDGVEAFAFALHRPRTLSSSKRAGAEGAATFKGPRGPSRATGPLKVAASLSLPFASASVEAWEAAASGAFPRKVAVAGPG